MLQRDMLPFFHSNFVIACVQNTVICSVVLALVLVLAGVLDLGVLGVLLLVGLLLDCTLFSYFLFLPISFYTPQLLHQLLSSICFDSVLDVSVFVGHCPSIAQLH